MKDLLYKEFKLALHPSVLIFPLLGALLLVPSYPYFIAFCYVFIGFANTFMIGRGNQDILFSVSLPVRKRDIVKARFATFIVIELIHIVIAIPFAILGAKLNPQGNTVGMDGNYAFFGLLFIMYAIFNTIFLTKFYKTGYKIAMGMFLACTAVTLYIIAIEISVHIFEPFKTLDTLSGHMTEQLIVLIGGILIFILSNVFAYKISARNFEKVDL